MFSLRPYQQSAVDQIRRAFAKLIRRVILCSPTGSGKTVTFADMAAKSVKNGMVTMVLCDRKELIGQAKDKLNELGLLPTVIAPGYKQIVNKIYLASVDTLRRRDLPKIDLLIIDEAHKQSFDKMILKYIDFCDPFIIGATATPLRTGNQNCLSTIYQEIVEPTTIEQLLEEGYLVSARTFAAMEDFTDVKKRGQEFDNSALFKKFDSPDLYGGVVENYLRFAKDKKAICFNVNVEHSKKTTEAFRNAGISAEHIDGNTPDNERRNILAAFKAGHFQVLCNCSVLTTGFDEPSIECVIVNRATLSLPLWLQMVGRGSRIFNNKDHFVVIDQGANVYRHGLWEEPREWQLHKKKKRKGDGVAPVKCCPECDSIVHASARVCNGTKYLEDDLFDTSLPCNYIFPEKDKEIKEAEFAEVTKKFSRRGKSNSKKLADIPDHELDNYAKEMGYKPGWAYHQRKLRGVI